MNRITFAHLTSLPELRQFYALSRRLFGVRIEMISSDFRQQTSLGDSSDNPFCNALEAIGLAKRIVKPAIVSAFGRPWARGGPSPISAT